MEEIKNELQNNSLGNSNYKVQIKQSNFLTEARHDMNATEQNLMYMVMGQIRNDDPEDALYAIQLSKLEKLTGKQINYKYLRSAFEKLEGSLYKVIEPDEVSSFAALTGVMYEPGSGVIIVQLSSKIRKYLFDLEEQFTLFKFKNALKLKSKYSKRIYEMLSQFKGEYKKQKEKKEECIINISVQELKERLKLIDSTTGFDKYTGFGEFARNVLKPAFEEINENTEISFEYKPIEPRTGRKIKKIAFKITNIEERKDGRSSSESDRKYPKKLPAPTQEASQPLPLTERLHKQCEIDPDLAKKAVKNLPDVKIELLIKAILKKYKSGKIDSLGGYSTTIFKAWLNGAEPKFEKTDIRTKHIPLKLASQPDQIVFLKNEVQEKLTNEFKIKYPQVYGLLVKYGESLDTLEILAAAVSKVEAAIERGEIVRNPEAIFEALISQLNGKIENYNQSLEEQSNERLNSVNSLGNLLDSFIKKPNMQTESAEEGKIRREKTQIWNELFERFENMDDKETDSFVEEYCVEALKYSISKVVDGLESNRMPHDPTIIIQELRKQASLWRP